MNNKLKNEMEKIKMPKDTKERIIAACENAEKRTTGTEEYTDHVYNAEHVNSRKRIIHSISAVAACALLAGGIGTTGVLLHKQGTVPFADVEPTTAVMEQTAESISPFGDFSTFEFSVGINNGNKVSYTGETNDKLAAFLNTFSWGEELSEEEMAEVENLEPDDDIKAYQISWKIDDTIYTLELGEIGYAVYNATRLVNNGGEMLEGNIYRIDFAAFDNGMQEILKDELATEETTVESPFTDIIKTAYLVDAFDASAREVTDEKIEALIKTYNSQTWTECDCADKFVDFDFTKLTRDYFVVVGSETIGTNEYLMTTYDGYACVYTEIITDDGNNEKSEKKCYKCDDTEFGEKLLDVYDPIESDNVEPGTQDMMDYNNIVALLNGNDCGGLVVWCDENGGWCKQDFDQNQYDTVKNYFNEHEVKEMVPNVYGVIEAKRWNDVFGLSQIQLYDKVKKEHTILYISKDSSMIAISRPSEDSYGDTIRIYKAEGLEALQFIRNFAE